MLPSRGAALLLATWALAAVACAGARGTPLPDRPVDFTFELGGETMRLSDLRGRPAVLVLVRISELTSELYLRQVEKAWEREAGKVRFAVLSLEPAERPLLEEYAEFNELPFEIGLAEWRVASGQSALGRIPIVPTTYFLDEKGRVADAAPGAIPAAEIEKRVEKLGWNEVREVGGPVF
ncbi:MAG: hypothetical protein R6V85_17085 [Polyangia bacterium]